MTNITTVPSGPKPFPNVDCVNGIFLTRYLQLRPDGAPRDMICVDPNTTPLTPNFVSGAYRYENQLRFLCCPAGFAFSVTVSDIFVSPSAAAAPPALAPPMRLLGDARTPVGVPR